MKRFTKWITKHSLRSSFSYKTFSISDFFVSYSKILYIPDEFESVVYFEFNATKNSEILIPNLWKLQWQLM